MPAEYRELSLSEYFSVGSLFPNAYYSSVSQTRGVDCSAEAAGPTRFSPAPGLSQRPCECRCSTEPPLHLRRLRLSVPSSWGWQGRQRPGPAALHRQLLARAACRPPTPSRLQASFLLLLFCVRRWSLSWRLKNQNGLNGDEVGKVK